jgi:hypothetical protein
VGLEGENRLRGEPERNEIDGFGNFVFVLGGSLFGGEKGQRPSAPICAASAAMKRLLARRIVTRLPAEASCLPKPWCREVA